MNIFIDTNIYLSFYHFSSEDLEELKKLRELLEHKQINLYLPDQVISEFRRNRENRIADAMKRLKDQKLNFTFPHFCKDYDDYGKLKEIQKAYSTHHSSLVEKTSKDIQSRKLKADLVIQSLFDLATTIITSKEVIENARLRMDLGNPPGKDNSIGDAINWELLLSTTPQGSDIFFISEDKDYISSLDEFSFKDFLIDEWKAKKSSRVIFFRSLSNFFKLNYPNIILASELEKDRLINSFASSGSFTNTHDIIRKLSQYSDFTIAQVNTIVESAITNSQIKWILGDSDVREFLTRVIKGKEEKIDDYSLNLLKHYLPDEISPPEDDYPF